MNIKSILGILGAAVCVLLAIVLMDCSHDYRVDDEESEIAEVVNGNTVTLADGLTVHLLGIDPSNSYTEDQLRNNYAGKTLRLVSDSEGDQTFTSYDDEVWCYGNIVETGEALNRKLLHGAGKKAYNAAFLNDSLDAYIAIFNSPKPVLDDVTLASKLKSSSFFIIGTEANGERFSGTGFFINGEGLAVSNNHVVHPGARYEFYLSDPQGNIDKDRAFGLNNIVYDSDHRYYPDYTIFYVNLDDDTKKRIQHLDLSNENLVAGAKIATVGNPSPGYELREMLYKTGVISSNHLDERSLFDIDIAITHGFSGGPIVNEHGDVIGISTAGYDNSNAQINFGTDINAVRRKLDEKNLSYGGK